MYSLYNYYSDNVDHDLHIHIMYVYVYMFRGSVNDYYMLIISYLRLISTLLRVTQVHSLLQSDCFVRVADLTALIECLAVLLTCLL